MTPPASVEALKAQLAQLDGLIADGVLKGAAAKQKRAALEAQLLQLIDGPGKAAPAVARPSRSMWLGVSAFVLLFGLAGYGWRGNLQGLGVGPGENVATSDAQAGSGAQAMPTEAQIDEMVQRLADRLKDKPDDATGWAMLARSYTAQGKFDKALPAFKRVMDLQPQDAQAIADYADALGAVNNNSLDGEPEQLVMQALKVDPANVKALSLAGTVAFNKAQYPQAVSYWEQAVKAADPAGGFAAQLQGALSEARKRAGMPDVAAPTAAVTAPAAAPAPAPAATPAGPTPKAAAATGLTISGRISLSPALKAKAAPDDTVFIFARAPSGSRMPLAIVRKKVSDLPFDYTLDDSTAMSPASTLSSATQVVVGARISKSGNAMPQPGDLQGFSAAVAPGTKNINVEIADVLP